MVQGKTWRFHTTKHCYSIFYVTHSSLSGAAEITVKSSGGGGAVVVWRCLKASLVSLREMFCFEVSSAVKYLA